MLIFFIFQSKYIYKENFKYAWFLASCQVEGKNNKKRKFNVKFLFGGRDGEKVMPSFINGP